MSDYTYHVAKGGLPAQDTPLQGRAVFTEAYAFIPKNVMTDIVTSQLPFWEKTRAWVLARPLSGFAETFSQYLVDVSPGGGSDQPDTETGIESILFVVGGEFKLAIGTHDYQLKPGSYVYLPAGQQWKLRNYASANGQFHWIRKKYVAVEGIELPRAFVTCDQAVTPVPMPDTDGKWATSRFVDPDNLRHDMHLNIVTFERGGCIPFEETHVMEHGIFVLEGKAQYKLNRDWVDVEAGDFMWLRAFCPQACRTEGEGRFRYLLYKDVNRHMVF